MARFLEIGLQVKHEFVDPHSKRKHTGLYTTATLLQSSANTSGKLRFGISQCRLFALFKTTLGAYGRVGAPAVEGGVRLLGQPVASVAPELFPRYGIA